MRIYFAIELSLREINYAVYVHALMCALMTRKSCAVGMHNAILMNHLECRHVEVLGFEKSLRGGYAVRQVQQ